MEINDIKLLVGQIMEDLKTTHTMCFDLETYNPKIVTKYGVYDEISGMQADIVSLSVATASDKEYFIPFKNDREWALQVLDLFRPVFDDKTVVKVGHGVKYDLLVLKNYGIEVASPYFDTIVAYGMLEPYTLKKGLKVVTTELLCVKQTDITELIGKGKNQKSMWIVPLDELEHYALQDVRYTLQIMSILKQRLQDEEMYEYFTSIEMNLLPVLVDMEYAGFKVNLPVMEKLIEKYSSRCEELKQQVNIMAGKEVNVNSHPQLVKLLFKDLGLMHPGKLTKGGDLATDNEVLEELIGAHPVVDTILDYKYIHRFKNSCLLPVIKAIDNKTGRVHTNINNFGVETGRLTTKRPNLQGIPKHNKELASDIRSCFIAENGNTMLWGDQSQLELRILAHFTGDVTMVEAFHNNACLHRHTASKIFGKAPEEVDKIERNKAKTVNFGIIYGMSAQGLSKRLGIDVCEAELFIDTYFEEYPQVKWWADNTKDESYYLGYAQTLLGRKRKLDFSLSRGALGRQAVNTPIQGTGAEIMKIAMINIHRRLKEAGLKSAMLLQVHDELVLEVTTGELTVVKDIVTHEMETAVKLNVPLLVEMKEGNCWWRE
jgi:DNA polymerase-1